MVKYKLPEKPPIAKIKNLLIELLQYSYQNLEIKKPNWEQEAIQEIRKILDR